MDETSVLGPVQNEMQYNKVRDLVEDARARGGRVLTGGQPIERPGYFYPITLVADVSDGIRLVDEEQFGPALPIIRYSDVDEVIERANRNPAGLPFAIEPSLSCTEDQRIKTCPPAPEIFSHPLQWRVMGARTSRSASDS